MRPILMPLKSETTVLSEKAEEMGTAEPLRNLRILLNKVTKANFARISDTILNSFVYNREILEELSVLTWRQKV